MVRNIGGHETSGQMVLSTLLQVVYEIREPQKYTRRLSNYNCNNK
jgi:hypothetical protein